MRDEVANMANVKQEMEMDLLQNVRNLQERVESQFHEKALLTRDPWVLRFCGFLLCELVFNRL